MPKDKWRKEFKQVKKMIMEGSREAMRMHKWEDGGMEGRTAGWADGGK